MPDLSRFYGIIIRMYEESGERHSVPHLHAYYQGHSAVYGIDPVVCLAGGLPRRQHRFVERRMTIHQNELARNWDLIDNGDAVESLPPLRQCVEGAKMQHQIVRVIDFEIVGPYTLWVRFDDESEQTINFEPMLEGHYFGPLRDLNMFNRVRLDPEIGTLVWPNDAAFDPATLHNWQRGDGEELARRAQSRRREGAVADGRHV